MFATVVRCRGEAAWLAEFDYTEIQSLYNPHYGWCIVRIPPARLEEFQNWCARHDYEYIKVAWDEYDDDPSEENRSDVHKPGQVYRHPNMGDFPVKDKVIIKI